MIVRGNDKVLVVGISGRQGAFWTEKMIRYGTQIVGGVSPKHSGASYCGVPVYSSVGDAAAHVGGDVAVVYVPPALCREAVVSTIEAGIGLIIILTEHIPSHDVMAIHRAAALHGTRIVGPNTAGLVTPGDCFVGIMPAFVPGVFKPGSIGVISRSGSLGTLTCLNLTRGGFGQSAFIGIGGDPMVGTTMREALEALDHDAATRAAVMVGEIGGGMEEEAAAYAKVMKKPVLAFIAGAASPPDRKMGHAGAIVTGSAGSYRSKRASLEGAGIAVVDTPAQLCTALAASLSELAIEHRRP